MNDMLKDKFQEYLTLSGSLRPAYVASLGSNPDGRTSITDLVPDAPELLQAIYSTVSGTSMDEEDPSLMEFIPGYRLIHIDEYEQQLHVLSQILQEKEQQVEGVILPILTNYGSDFICYYRSPEGEEQICDLLQDYGDMTVMFDSPDQFLDTLCEFYKQDVYFLDEEGYLDCDLIKEGEVGAALNPHSRYWSE